MKICKIIAQKSLQFDDCVIDLTYPESHPKAGEPLEKVCFIGPNGTGKTRILELITQFFAGQSYGFQKNTVGDFSIQYKNNEEVLILKKIDRGIFEPETYFQNDFLVFIPENLYADFIWNTEKQRQPAYLSKDERGFAFPAVYDAQYNVPNATLNESKYFFEKKGNYFKMEEKGISEFWSALILLIEKRKAEYLAYQNENENLTIKQAKENFNANNPSILEKIAVLWNKILAPLNLYFDVENAQTPIQLLDNLLVYIKTLDTNKNVPFHLLSAGIQNFIFKMGYLKAIHFYNTDKNSLVLIDEPEDSLHPRFLYGIVDLYKEITGGEKSQLFVATHSEVVAAQFEPYERVILDFDPDKFGTVKAHRGISPKGQNASDVLMNDFGTKFYQHDDAEKAHREFIRLQRTIRSTTDENTKKELLDKARELAFRYKFPVFEKNDKL